MRHVIYSRQTKCNHVISTCIGLWRLQLNVIVQPRSTVFIHKLFESEIGWGTEVQMNQINTPLPS